MPEPFRTSRRVEFSDTDMAGIVHFANFFRYMETAEQDFLRSLGLSVAMQWDRQSLGFPRVAASCDYLKPAYFEDELEIRVSVVKVGQKSVTYRFEFFKPEGLIARGQTTAVFCRVDGPRRLQAIELPAFLRERLEHGVVSTDDPPAQ